MRFLQWVEGTALSIWVLESDYGFYTMLALHALGMALLVGPLAMLAARALGFAAELPYAPFQRLLTIAWIGFLVSLGSGIALFGPHARQLAVSTLFLTKMALIAAAALAVWRLWRGIGEQRPVRRIAAASLLLWFLVILAGRFVGYTIYSTA